MSTLPPLRLWQERAIPLFVNGALRGAKDQLAYVTPSAGKTRFSLEVATELRRRNEIRRMVVIVHTHNLREQWKEDAAENGVLLTDDIARDPNVDGFVVTYQQLVDEDTRHAVFDVVKGTRQTLVVADECHHMGDKQSWGTNCQQAFRKAHRRLLLSGTPVREDDRRIPFVTYRAGTALADGIVPPVYFPTIGGMATWKIGDEEQTTTEAAESAEKQARRLNTQIGSPDWMRATFRAAHSRLMELREHHPDAAGLLICKDQSHARFAAELAAERAQSVRLAVSDDRHAHEAIRAFRHSNDQWMVAVRMVSEGVSIERLRVGVYATNYRTELFFRQVVGRFTRYLLGLADQSAFVYLPDHPDLARFAQELQINRVHTLRDKASRQSARVAHGNNDTGTGDFVAGIAEAMESVTLLPGSQFSAEELTTAEAVRNLSPMLRAYPIEVVAEVLRRSAEAASSVTAQAAP